MIALMSIVLFLASVAVLFFIARRLFDQQLALLSCALVLVCDMFWQYSLSGLPQMLLLLLFNLTIYAFVRAVEENDGGGSVANLARRGRCRLWFARSLPCPNDLDFSGGAHLFASSIFGRGCGRRVCCWRPFFSSIRPWLLRNYLVCGNPAGVAIYSFFDQRRTERSRAYAPDRDRFSAIGLGAFRNKIAGNLTSQTDKIFQYLAGASLRCSFSRRFFIASGGR